ncbi:MAG TPA: hypothetical protein VII01_00850 [Solirubrobacteraceae bacterium]|jgi:hypothetical protein
MRSLQLQAALSEYVELVAAHLHADVAAGAEVAFEVEQAPPRRGSGGPALYCYRPMTAQFIAERMPALERLPGHPRALAALEGFDGLGRYVAALGADVQSAGGRAAAHVALSGLLAEVFAEQSDFELVPERLEAAMRRLELSASASSSEVTVVGTLHGLTITSAELPLTRGLTIAKPQSIDGLPAAVAVAEEETPGGHLVVVLSVEDDDPQEGLARAREVLEDLLRALRLFGDGRVTLGSLGWARTGEGTWSALALGARGRPHGMLVVTAEQEDELRAFSNLVSRRAPHGNELAWALRRFELGCERQSSLEGLSDHLLALRALLEPEGAGSGLLIERLVALCATPERRPVLRQRAAQAVELERAAIAGKAVENAGAQALAQETADHLRALLRDVICGHLEPELVTFADELLAADAPDAEPEADRFDEPEAIYEPEAEYEQDELDAFAAPSGDIAAPAVRRVRPASGEEVLGYAGEPEEILDLYL